MRAQKRAVALDTDAVFCQSDACDNDCNSAANSEGKAEQLVALYNLAAKSFQYKRQKSFTGAANKPGDRS
jgi:hypothetical protein